MKWRAQSPVYSPIAPAGLLAGLNAALGFGSTTYETVRQTLCMHYSASDALLTDSGTSALVLALRAVVPSGGSVAFPAYACVDLTAAAVRAGLTVRLYDLDPGTLSPDLDSVRQVLTRGVNGIVAVHFFGYPSDMRAVQELALSHGVAVIEDAAQAAGGTLAGQRLGAFADISILSFGRGKGTTCASGGAVLVRKRPLVNWADRTRDALGSPQRGGDELLALLAQWVFGRPSLYRIPVSVPALNLGEMVYHPAGEPLPMTSVAAALLNTALTLEANEVERRRHNAQKLLAVLGRRRRLVPVRVIATGEPGYLRLAVLDTSASVAPDRAFGLARGYPMTLDQHPQLRALLAHGEKAGAGSLTLRDKLFTLPTHSRVGPADFSLLAHWAAAGDAGQLRHQTAVA